MTVVSLPPISDGDSSTSIAYTHTEVCSMLIGKYAEIMACGRTEFDEEFSQKGDLKLDSAPAEGVIIKMEKQLGRKLLTPSDLRSDQPTTVTTLADLILRKLRSPAV